MQQPFFDLNWPYVQITYPALARVLGDEDALREFVAVLTLVYERARALDASKADA